MSARWRVSVLVCRRAAVSARWCVGAIARQRVGVSARWCVGALACWCQCGALVCRHVDALVRALVRRHGDALASCCWRVRVGTLVRLGVWAWALERGGGQLLLHVIDS